MKNLKKELRISEQRVNSLIYLWLCIFGVGACALIRHMGMPYFYNKAASSTKTI